MEKWIERAARDTATYRYIYEGEASEAFLEGFAAGIAYAANAVERLGRIEGELAELTRRLDRRDDYEVEQAEKS